MTYQIEAHQIDGHTYQPGDRVILTEWLDGPDSESHVLTGTYHGRMDATLGSMIAVTDDATGQMPAVMTVRQAQRIRFRGGDPLALTKRIEARRPAHSYLDELRPAREPIEPIVTSWREAWSILWQAGLLIVLFVGIAWTGPIFAAAMGR